MAGIRVPKISSGVKPPKFGKIAVPHVPVPASNPLGVHRVPRGFARIQPPRIKPLNTRIYNKKLVSPDPSQYGQGPGFGNTGLTGES